MWSLQRPITSFFPVSDSSPGASSAGIDLIVLQTIWTCQSSPSNQPSDLVWKLHDHRRRSGFDHSWVKKHICLLSNGMICKLCTKYNMMPRNGSGKWITAGCTAFRHGKVLAHENSAMHKEAERARSEEARAAVSGGIRATSEDGISHERRAVIGALKCVYLLVKNELPHTTNFCGLLGCDYLRNLHQGSNASYRSDRIIDEFIQSLYECVTESVLERMHQSNSVVYDVIYLSIIPVRI